MDIIETERVDRLTAPRSAGSKQCRSISRCCAKATYSRLRCRNSPMSGSSTFHCPSVRSRVAATDRRKDLPTRYEMICPNVQLASRVSDVRCREQLPTERLVVCLHRATGLLMMSP